MFRIPILFVIAGITGFMLYKNEQQRVEVNTNNMSSLPVLGRESLPQAPVFDSDEEFSDSDASIESLDELNLRK